MTRETAARRAYRLEQFEDYLSLEAGLSPRTVESYRRDLYRLVKWAAERGAVEPAALNRSMLRKHVFALKDAYTMNP